MEYIGVPEEVAKKAARHCTLALGLAKKEIAKFLRCEKVIEVTQNIVNTVSEGVVKVVEAGKRVSEKTTEVITNIASAAGKTVKALYEDAKTTLKKGCDTMQKTVKAWFKRMVTA